MKEKEQWNEETSRDVMRGLSADRINKRAYSFFVWNRAYLLPLCSLNLIAMFHNVITHIMRYG